MFVWQLCCVTLRKPADHVFSFPLVLGFGAAPGRPKGMSHENSMDNDTCVQHAH